MVELNGVANGVFKSFCFALIIGVVSCHRACDHRRAARYRNSVTKAVVNSIVLIVIFDYILTRIPLK